MLNHTKMLLRYLFPPVLLFNGPFSLFEVHDGRSGHPPQRAQSAQRALALRSVLGDATEARPRSGLWISYLHRGGAEKPLGASSFRCPESGGESSSSVTWEKSEKILWKCVAGRGGEWKFSVI